MQLAGIVIPLDWPDINAQEEKYSKEKAHTMLAASGRTRPRLKPHDFSTVCNLLNKCVQIVVCDKPRQAYNIKLTVSYNSWTNTASFWVCTNRCGACISLSDSIKGHSAGNRARPAAKPIGFSPSPGPTDSSASALRLLQPSCRAVGERAKGSSIGYFEYFIC